MPLAPSSAAAMSSKALSEPALLVDIKPLIDACSTPSLPSSYDELRSAVNGWRRLLLVGDRID
jgi:hypothetical protein